MSAALIEQLSNRVLEYEDRVRTRFAALQFDQLAWQPDPRSWSIGQCLEHLIELNELYFSVFADIASGAKRRTFIERIPVLPGLWGTLLLNGVKPDNAKKMRAPLAYDPSVADISPDIVEQFCTHQQALAASISSLADIDLDAQIIKSPVVGFITYSLRHAILIIVEHEERHLNQADRVLETFDVHSQNTEQG